MSKRTAAALWTGAALMTVLAAWWLVTLPPAPPANPPGTRIEWAEPAAVPLPTERVAVPAREGAAEKDSGDTRAADGSITLRALLDDGRPAGGARVDVGALQRNATAWFRGVPFENEPKAPVQASFTTDADGEVRLPWRHDEIGDVPISVQHGVAFASTTISTTAPRGSTHAVQLAIDQTLQVRVVDANDRPAPEVFVGARATVRRADGRDSEGTLLAKAHTGADGGATFAHVQSWLARIAPQPSRTFEVYAWLPGGDVAVALDAAALPREPVVLRIRPAGSIEITAHAADGTALTGETVCLGTTDGDGVVLAQITVPATTIAHVPLGEKWQAWVPYYCDRSELNGPLAAGETVRISLRATPCPLVVGRLLRDGSPLANAPVSSVGGLDLAWTTSMLLGRRTTDADGRFRLMPRASCEAVQTIHFDVKDDQGVTWRATWRGNLELTLATHDLGDLHLERLERGRLMVSGRVVAPRGLDSVQLRAVHARGERRAAVEQEVKLKHDGTFVIHGADPGAALALAVESSSHLLEPWVPFAFGQHELVVTLRAGVRLVAAFPVTSRHLAQCLRIGLEAIPADHGEDDDVYAVAPDQQRFDSNTVECTWHACEPGPRRLTIRFDKGPGKAVASVDVNLPAGAREVRVPQIVVPEARLVRLRLPLPLRSDRVTEPYVSVQRIVGDDTHDTGVEEAGGQWLLALTEPVDVRVHVPGYRARVLRAVFEDTTITLDPAIPIDLIVNAPGVPDGATVYVSMHGGEAMVDAMVTNGRTRLLLPDDGEYSIDLRVHLAWADMQDWRCEPDSITVPEHGGTFTIRAQPPGK